ncbi:MAG TPA: MlaD family protein [Candidatus Paceibacterota bacterium]|nr:MlaD family protein [Verrucomicrobiota bacterium]HRY51771.1 MlaD family protein [Candidatus Paceibacterota bacterium]
MALHDLTPQLRTRLGRVERLVGLFVGLAALLLIAGFLYYIYHAAKRKGWLVTKVPYYTLMYQAEGLNVGDPVKLMGFDIGEITQVEPMPPDSHFGVYVAFQVKEPFFGYVWTDSEIRVGSGNLLGNRYLEVMKGGLSGRTNLSATYKWDADRHLVMYIDPDPENQVAGHVFERVDMLKRKPGPFKGYFLLAYESPPINEQVTRLIQQVETALPNLLGLTNPIAATLNQTTQLVAGLDNAVHLSKPLLTNLGAISEQLRDPNGSLGRWLLPPAIDQQIQRALGSANSTLNTAETNLSLVASNLNRSLENLAQITGNLNHQVQANSLILSEISSLVLNTDELIRGLQRHWLLRGAFRKTATEPENMQPQPSVGGQP